MNAVTGTFIVIGGLCLLVLIIKIATRQPKSYYSNSGGSLSNRLKNIKEACCNKFKGRNYGG